MEKCYVNERHNFLQNCREAYLKYMHELSEYRKISFDWAAKGGKQMFLDLPYHKICLSVFITRSHIKIEFRSNGPIMQWSPNGEVSVIFLILHHSFFRISEYDNPWVSNIFRKRTYRVLQSSMFAFAVNVPQTILVKCCGKGIVLNGLKNVSN